MKTPLRILFLAALSTIIAASVSYAQEAVPWAQPQPWTGIWPGYSPPVCAPPVPVVPVYRDHALTKHGQDAVTAREIIRQADPKNCFTFRCATSVNPTNELEVCPVPGDPNHFAVQWRYRANGDPNGTLYEGTSFLMLRSSLDMYLRTHKCQLYA